MKIPDMNEKNTRAFLDKVRERASSYTPEWRMDLENPDGGTALALLFAGMYEDTLKKYAQLPRKSMLDFFNCVGTALAPARPAGGYAVFGLVNQEADGTVDLNDVCFSYVPDKKLIEGFNLHVKKGQRIAIVGPTGCGKTTVINLLMRFYDVNSGSIDVSGTDIRQMTRKSLRQGFGMVLQETWLKSGTIRENIVMGKPDATEEEIIAAAKAAHSYGFIKRMSNGFDTVIGEDGGSLSQGQKQLLCITRIMLAKPPMLILDESTSSIDTRTEIKIQNAFAKLMEGRTSFIVAHRLSTIQSADVILVMKDGHIIEQGNHEELLAKNGFYHKLYYSQFDTAAQN